jgi:glycerophosphoryl diester phosphodiesterase
MMLILNMYKSVVIAFLLCMALLPLFAQNALPTPKHGKTYVIAHRGAHSGIPENSLPAYQKAIDLGCDFIEIDIRTTKDGGLVSVHNDTVDAYVTQAKGTVKDFTMEEIRTLDIGEKIGPEWKGTQVPTFEEILKLSQGKIGIYLDLKEADPLVLIPLLRKYDMAEQTVWYLGGNAQDQIQTIQAQCPECLVMPDPGAEINIDRVVEKFHPPILATDMGELSATFVVKAHRAQALVFVDDRLRTEDEWDKILDFGTDGIQTDRPEALIRYLNSLTEKD